MLVLGPHHHRLPDMLKFPRHTYFTPTLTVWRSFQFLPQQKNLCHSANVFACIAGGLGHAH